MNADSDPPPQSAGEDPYADFQGRDPVYIAAVLSRTYEKLSRRTAGSDKRPLRRLETLMRRHAVLLRQLDLEEKLPDKLEQFVMLVERFDADSATRDELADRFARLSAQIDTELLTPRPPQARPLTPGGILYLSPQASEQEKYAFEAGLRSFSDKDIAASIAATRAETEKPASLYGDRDRLRPQLAAALEQAERLLRLRQHQKAATQPARRRNEGYEM